MWNLLRPLVEPSRWYVFVSCVAVWVGECEVVGQAEDGWLLKEGAPVDPQQPAAHCTITRPLILGCVLPLPGQVDAVTTSAWSAWSRGAAPPPPSIHWVGSSALSAGRCWPAVMG